MIEIVKGEAKEIIIILEDELGGRLDLSPYDQFKVCLSGVDITEVANANGSVVTKNGSDDLGELLASYNPPDTEAMQTGANQEMQIELSSSTNANEIARFVIDNAVTVKDFTC